MLAVPVRPSELEVREQEGPSSSSLGVASRHGVVTPIVRRTSTGPTQTHSPYIAPEVSFDPRPMRTTALVALQAPSRAPDTSIVLTRTSRGPPRG